MTISALARTNTRELLIQAYRKLEEMPPLEQVELPLPVYKPKEDPREFAVTREGSQRMACLRDSHRARRFHDLLAA